MIYERAFPPVHDVACLITKRFVVRPFEQDAGDGAGVRLRRGQELGQFMAERRQSVVKVRCVPKRVVDDADQTV